MTFPANWQNARTFVLVLAVISLSACRNDMARQPRANIYESSSVFADHRSARPPVPGAVARGHLDEDEELYLGTNGKTFASTFPFAIDRRILDRGEERFNIYCAPCHDRLATGNGIIVQRGYPRPPDFHQDGPRNLPLGYVFDVISNGFGRMPSYGTAIEPADRWAIIAYIKTLQFSRHIAFADLNGKEKQKLRESEP